ncbi:MAG: hypothetical protein E7261_11340 [Lachnospiraceae bacterium]|nr:hypothetical protein [Lachnospiraceae bacterium]
MGEKDLIALEQYDIAVLRSWKGREAMLCETNRGLMLLREYTGTEEKLEAEAWLLDRLLERKVKTDSYERNKDGKVVTTTADNKSYYLKNWPEGQEIDIKSGAGSCLAVKSLAILHMNMNEIDVPQEIVFAKGRSFKEDMRRHNKELKHVRGFIRSKRSKSDFELKVLECFDLFYGQGEKTLEYMCSEKNLISGDESTDNSYMKTLCHGNFNHHNILAGDRGVFVTNFDRVSYNNQITDLYLLLRKCMEKQNWNAELGIHMLREYDKLKPITAEEKRIIYILFLYPEKFWKIVNHYYNGNKSWVSGKSIGKLQALVELETKRQIFLDELQRL